MNKSTFFVNQFYYYSGKYGIDFYKVERDNRIDTECQVEYKNVKNTTPEHIIRVSYNSKRLKRFPLSLILADVLHEIGHIIQDLPTNTFEEEVESEYQAERFALLELQKINKRYFLQELRHITSDKCKKRLINLSSHQPHLEAYKKLEVEFKEYL